MSSEVITKNGLKAIFDEVLPSTLPATSVSATDYMGNITDAQSMLTVFSQYDRHTPFGAMEYHNSTAVANSNYSDTGSWHYPNNFTGYNITHASMDYGYGYWSEDINGFRILKKGIYELNAVAHFNNSAGACSHAIHFYNYTNSSQIGVVQYNTNTTGYASVSNHYVGLIEANKTIVIQAMRYSTGSSGSKWKLTDARFDIKLIQDLELYDPTA